MIPNMILFRIYSTTTSISIFLCYFLLFVLFVWQTWYDQLDWSSCSQVGHQFRKGFGRLPPASILHQLILSYTSFQPTYPPFLPPFQLDICLLYTSVQPYLPSTLKFPRCVTHIPLWLPPPPPTTQTSSRSSPPELLVPPSLKLKVRLQSRLSLARSLLI